MNIKTLSFSLILVCSLSNPVLAADYVIDKKGQHAFITFKASHLGYSYIIGRFENFSGSFSHDPKNPGNSKVSVSIEAKSLDTNHAERDKHLRGSEFFDVSKYPTITFESVAVSGSANAGKITGDLSLHGVTKSVVLDVIQIGEGKDPWGGYRSGFQGTVTIKAMDFGMPNWVGDVTVELIVEGVRQ